MPRSIRESLESATQRIGISRVDRSFGRARYDSDLNKKPWRTYYFYLNGKAVPEHLEECPITTKVLEQVPHNGLHVCFSAIDPGGALVPHTGPTNTSLTAHLGLLNCEDSLLCVANRSQTYKTDDVVIFDDSFVHWAANNGTRTRYTLIITFWHPELTFLERALLNRLIGIAQ
jgi:beta-hydroxylase